VKKIPLGEAKKQLLLYLDRKRGPLMIGEAAITLGPCWSLKDAEELLDVMVEEKTLRRIREDEQRHFDTRIAYVRCT
jgi:hypothetical protein